ncbi:sugar 3,4-ketoisomerase [Methylobacterium planeticum]|uniref:Sugar 3,4-ketoisomerase QdtA cupin domain-containing protein n=1 Tax=Methylobacterium planeticum TaxID=2615211 RepID=A0A6N6MLE1_9HYPH|nr:FdtA/QdtA family cupin domain-containing protein [Methylobacterium planeticum]KAB1070555.1 hypothetical protein F6X51_22045 [Methylobacterium planeticum]
MRATPSGRDLIAGVRLLSQRVHADARGELVAFEQSGNLPFPAERIFFLRVDRTGVVRGGHANSCDELIVPLSGSVLVEVDNGSERTAIRLRDRDQALWIEPGILIHLREFEPRTVLLVFASARYSETRHYDRAQPHMVAADRAA